MADDVFLTSIRKARVKIFSKGRIVSSNNDGENLILESIHCSKHVIANNCNDYESRLEDRSNFIFKLRSQKCFHRGRRGNSGGDRTSATSRAEETRTRDTLVVRTTRWNVSVCQPRCRRTPHSKCTKGIRLKSCVRH